MPPLSAKTTRSWWPAALILAAACLFCWPVFLGRVMLPADMCLLMLPWRELQGEFGFLRPHNPMFDPIQQYLPWRIYAVESLRSGLLPLWNPYAFCGTPFLANLQSTVLYPPNLLFLVTGARHGFGISAILHLCIGGIFMFAFLRSLSLRPAAALFGALVLMFNGFTVTWLEFPTLSLWVLMWLPALLWCFEKALRRPGSIWPVLTALVVGAQFLGGHLQMSAYIVIAFLLYAVVRLIAPGEARGRGYTIALPIIVLGLGLALAFAQILPTLELAEHSGRVAHGAGAAVATAFPLTHFILYLVPNFFGNPAHYNYWGNFRDPTAINFFETACYVGILPLFLAAWSLRRWREPHVWFFGGLTLFAALVAIGSPLYLLLYWLAPGFRELAGLGRILCLAAFGLAALAAFGLNDLIAQESRHPARRVLIGAAVLAALVTAAAVTFAPLRAQLPAAMNFDSYFFRQIAFTLALLTAAAALIALRLRLRIRGSVLALLAIAILALDLFAHGIGFNPFTDARMAYPDTDTTRWLQERAGHHRVASLASDSLDWMAHNSPMIFRLRDIHGSDSLRVRRSFELVSGPKLDQAKYPEPDSPLLDMLGVRYLVTRRDVSDGWRLARPGETPIYENIQALPRAYVIPRDEVAETFNGSAGFEADEPDRIVLKVEAERPATLVLMDSYYPGWRARLDGEPADLLDFAGGFRAVSVPAGKHVVELTYEPATFRVGMFVSLLALLVLSAAGCALSLRSRDSAERTASRS